MTRGNPPAGDARSAGLALLAGRAHTSEELHRKLSRKGYSPAEIAAAVEELSSRGWLDDVKTASAMAAAQAGRGAERRGLRPSSRRGASPPKTARRRSRGSTRGPSGTRSAAPSSAKRGRSPPV